MNRVLDPNRTRCPAGLRASDCPPWPPCGRGRRKSASCSRPRSAGFPCSWPISSSASRAASIGEVTGIDIQRTEPGRPGTGVHSGGPGRRRRPRAAARLHPHRRRPGPLDKRSGFRCADAAEIGAGDLVERARSSSSPPAVTRPLYLPGRTSIAGAVPKSGSLDASLTTDDRGGVRAQGQFRRAERRRGRSGEAYPPGGFAGRGDFGARRLGRSLLDFSADQTRRQAEHQGRQRRNLMRLLADSLGAGPRVLRTTSASAPTSPDRTAG